VSAPGSTFRDVGATMLFRSGWNAPQVQRHLGHSDAGFTLRRYVHLLDSDVPEPGFLDDLTESPRDRRTDDRDDRAAVGARSAAR
jgi:hypothetical protein